jgi:hypothetical protein
MWSEFSVLTFLGRVGLEGVPRAMLRSDAFSYGVYSFEPGSARTASELQTRDVQAIAEFAARLHGVDQARGGSDLAPAVDASFSFAGLVGATDARLRAFEEFAASAAAYEEVRELCRVLDLRARITELNVEVLAGLADADRQAELPRSDWRLNTADFGPQNMLFAPDGGLTVVDFETAGWDDPASLVMGFVAHAASEDLPPDVVRNFLDAYAEKQALSAPEIARFERVGLLFDLEWVAIYATALTSEAVAAKEFANREFDRHAHLTRATGLVKRRLARAAEGVGYRFSRR